MITVVLAGVRLFSLISEIARKRINAVNFMEQMDLFAEISE